MLYLGLFSLCHDLESWKFCMTSSSQTVGLFVELTWFVVQYLKSIVWYILYGFLVYGQRENLSWWNWKSSHFSWICIYVYIGYLDSLCFEVSVQFFCLFFYVVVFLFLICRTSLCMLDTNPLISIYIANIIYSVICLCIALTLPLVNGRYYYF